MKPELEIHHYDLYRLGQTGIVGEELAEDLVDPQVITIVEWAGIAHNQLPADRLTITFETTGENTRQLAFEAGGPIHAAALTAWRQSRPEAKG